jgi:hypothetical protein
MTEHLYPHSVADLELAPVLISIERNLAELRDAADLEYTLVLELNDDDSFYRSPTERARRIQRFATGRIGLHGLNVYPSQDQYRLAVLNGRVAYCLIGTNVPHAASLPPMQLVLVVQSYIWVIMSTSSRPPGRSERCPESW